MHARERHPRSWDWHPAGKCGLERPHCTRSVEAVRQCRRPSPCCASFVGDRTFPYTLNVGISSISYVLIVRIWHTVYSLTVIQPHDTLGGL